jgi:hypothetical protein
MHRDIFTSTVQYILSSVKAQLSNSRLAGHMRHACRVLENLYVSPKCVLTFSWSQKNAENLVERKREGKRPLGRRPCVIKVSLNHTFPISLHYNTDSLQIIRKSSQADFLCSSVLLQLTAILFFAFFCSYYYSSLGILLTNIAKQQIRNTGNTYHVMTIQQVHWRTCTDIRYRYLLLCDVTADTENTAFSIFPFWTVFTELLPGNALIKSVWSASPCSDLYDSGFRIKPC